MGMTYNEMFHSRFLAAADLKANVTLTIDSVKQDTVEHEDKTKEDKWTIIFREKRKDGSPCILVLNRTNAMLIFAMWPNTDQWIGKRITLAQEEDHSPINETGLCIRVFGSPDITQPISVTIKLPRKRPAKRTLQPTAKATGTLPLAGPGD